MIEKNENMSVYEKGIEILKEIDKELIRLEKIKDKDMRIIKHIENLNDEKTRVYHFVKYWEHFKDDPFRLIIDINKTQIIADDYTFDFINNDKEKNVIVNFYRNKELIVRIYLVNIIVLNIWGVIKK